MRVSCTHVSTSANTCMLLDAYILSNKLEHTYINIVSTADIWQSLKLC